MSTQTSLAITLQNRKATKKLLDFVSIEQANMIPSGFNNNMIWQCGHILAVQQMLTYGLARLPFTIPKDIVNGFSPGTKPKDVYDSDFVAGLQKMLFTSYEQLVIDIEDGKFEKINPFMTALRFEIHDIESAILFNQYHEALHMGHTLSISRFL